MPYLGSVRTLDSRPRPTEGVASRDLGDEYMFYDSAHEQVHVLNTTAREIFLLCDGTASVQDIVERFGARFGVDDSTARRDVEETLDRLVSLGLVGLAS
jgi:PqqD family protein of HPr-rel-A system